MLILERQRFIVNGFNEFHFQRFVFAKVQFKP